MKKKVFSILGTLMFAALFMMNISFFNENQDSKDETFDPVITTTSAKAAHYPDYKNRTFHRGCRAAGGICELTTSAV